MNEKRPSPQEEMAGFAARHIRPRQHLARDTVFPVELWEKMGAAGLLDLEKIRVAAEQSGQDCFPVLGEMAREMVKSGGSLGLTMAWIIHHLNAGIIMDAAPASRQHPFDHVLAEMKKGRALLSFALSEPDAGGHPKLLKTRAEKKDSTYLISGEKTYLTCGPIANWFIVTAITGIREGRKLFSTFLVNRDTPGLTVLPGMDLSFFRPVPHGSIRFDDCRVSAECMIGDPGSAFPDLVLPFRQREDALMSSAVAGAVELLSSETGLEVFKRKPAGETLSKEKARALGQLAADAAAARVLSDHLTRNMTGRLSEGVLLHFKTLAADFLQKLETLLNQEIIQLKDPAAALFEDLAASGRIGKSMSGIRLQKLGNRMVESAEMPAGVI